MYPWRTILIPTDFSTASEWVFDDAIRLAGTTGAELVILHVRMTWSAHPTELRLPADPALYEYAEQYELERLRDRVARANANVATRLIVRSAPDPGNEITRAATDEKADLVVIATHARHHVAHLIIGSTTAAVIANPPCPVVAIRYGTRKRTSMQRIVVPIHTRQEQHPALNLAAAIVAREGGELHLLTICEDAERSAAEALLGTVTSSLPPTDVQRAIVRGDDIEKEICRYAEKSDADVVFLNAHHELGPLKRDIIRHVGTPVMIVPV